MNDIMDSCVAIDSNSLSYLINAIKLEQKPIGNLAGQKIALVRICLYRTEVLFLPPTARKEYKRIKDDGLKKDHNGVSMVLLIDVPISDPEITRFQTLKYSKYHTGKKRSKDCQILAEAELGECDYLLTYDFDFLSHLKGKTEKIQMLTPLKFWNLLNIPRGSQPIRIPHPTNPLAKKRWWIW